MASSRPFAEVIGDPIEHSLSPDIYGFWFECLGIEADYLRTRVGRSEFAEFLEKRRGDQFWRGCNVTMPLKLDALSLADEASDLALGAGAANLLLNREGRVLAGNTDVTGLVALLERAIDESAGTGVITVLGSGGAARAALMALRLMDISSVRIQARNLTEAYTLAVQFRLEFEPRPFHMALEGDGLINATPLGMKNAAAVELSLAGLSAGGWVLDLVTSREGTDLIKRAKAAGLKTFDGIAMLVEQAAVSFETLFGAKPPRDRDAELFARLRS